MATYMNPLDDPAVLSYEHFFNVNRNEAEMLLYDQPQGTFLVRPSSQPFSLVISMRHTSKVPHFIVLRRDNGYGVDPEKCQSHSFGSESFPTLQLLVSRMKQLGIIKVGLVNKTHDLPHKEQQQVSVPPVSLQFEYTISWKVPGQMERTVVWTAGGLCDLLQHEQILKVGTADFLKREKISQQLEFKRQKSEIQDLCVICLNARRELVIIDCGHMVFCNNCYAVLEKRECPLCRKKISSVVFVFQS